MTPTQWKAFRRAYEIDPGRVLLNQVVMTRTAADWLVRQGYWESYEEDRRTRYRFTVSGVDFLRRGC